MNKEIDLIEIKTTAYEEENFLLVTNLQEFQIVKVITPIVEKERENDGETFFYDNETLFWALKETYPNAIIQMYAPGNIPIIEI